MFLLRTNAVSPGGSKLGSNCFGERLIRQFLSVSNCGRATVCRVNARVALKQALWTWLSKKNVATGIVRADSAFSRLESSSLHFPGDRHA